MIPRPTIKPESQSPVVFDEDYRAHIWRLMALLDHERREVFELRAELRKIRAERSGQQVR